MQIGARVMQRALPSFDVRWHLAFCEIRRFVKPMRKKRVRERKNKRRRKKSARSKRELSKRHFAEGSLKRDSHA